MKGSKRDVASNKMLPWSRFLVAGFVMAFSMPCYGGQDAKRPERNLRFGIPLTRLTPILGQGGSCKQGSYGPGDYVRPLVVDDRDRFYEVHVPRLYKPGKPAPLVLVFHGGGGSPTAIRWQTKLDKTSDRDGFIVVYPAGTGLLGKRLLTYNAGLCCGYALKHKVDDVAFVNTVLDDVGKFFCVDPNRVYATGLSNGAQMCYLLACELSDRIAAIAPVSAPMALRECHPTRPISVMHFHGLDDKNVPFNGGVGPHGVTGFKHMSIPDNIDFWVAHDGCPSKPAKQWKQGHGLFTSYGPGKDGTEVVLCRIEGAGHTWPGGDVATKLEGKIVGRVCPDVSASDLIWAFFERHPMPSKR